MIGKYELILLIGKKKTSGRDGKIWIGHPYAASGVKK